MEHVVDVTIQRAYLTLSKWLIKKPLKVSILPYSRLSCENNHDFKVANNTYKRIT